ncbi:MAG: hypothetical protein ACXVHO_09170 [Methanobacterium sp.]
MPEESEIKTYDDGVKDGKKEMEKQIGKKECLELYKEGYKAG